MKQISLFLLLFGISLVVPTPAFATALTQSAIPSPYCLGSCPTPIIPSPTIPPKEVSRTPSSAVMIAPTTAGTAIPCTDGTVVSIQHHQAHTKSSVGTLGNFMDFFLQLITQLLNMFLQMPRDNAPTQPLPLISPTQTLRLSPEQPTPPCQPTTPTQTIPTETETPTSAPTQTAEVTSVPTEISEAVIPPPGGPWTLIFQDEFTGATVDTTKWSFTSSAESTCDTQGCSNPGNQQLEYNSGANCSVAEGILTITARKENKGGRSWTSCMLHSKPQFQYMYMEERTKLPAKIGFWPAFWTWNGPSQEIDVYEYYSDNHTKLYMTSHAGNGGGCNWTPPFDPSADYHVYAADIRQDGVTFYVDGKQVCTAAGTLSQPASILVDLFVYEKIPPEANTLSETKLVDYVRAWKR